jgi:threonine/homoserine/homoserine lactone efflux protein
VTDLSAFLLASLVIELTPGPNMAYLAGLAATRGLRTGLAAVAGVALGLAALGLLAAFGVATLVRGNPAIYEVLRWAGVAYLLWLAWTTATGEERTDGQGVGDMDHALPAFRAGLVTNLLNPKALIFYVAVLPTFSGGADATLTSVVALSGAYVAVATIVHMGVVLGASRLRPILYNAEKRRQARKAFAVALVGIAIWFAIGTSR